MVSPATACRQLFVYRCTCTKSSTHRAGVAALLSSRSYATASPLRIASILGQTAPADPQAPTKLPDQDITINGYVRSIRKQKRVAFAAIGDGSTLESMQAVLTPEQADRISNGTALSITGRWVPSPKGKEQAHELQAKEVRIVGDGCAEEYPIQKKYQSLEFLRTLPHLRSRLPFNSLLLRLRSQLIAHATVFFAKENYVQTHPPIITSSDCEGAGEVFTVSPASSDKKPATSPSGSTAQQSTSFFSSPKYLTVSSQLHLEALAQSVGNVWALSPTFRAEKSDTPRHLSEFYMLEAELAFCESLHEVMNIVERLVRSLATQLKGSSIGQELLLARESQPLDESHEHLVAAQQLEDRWNALIQDPWPRITYSKAVEHLVSAEKEGKIKFEFSPAPEDGLQAEHEKFLAGPIGFNGPVFVTDYPKSIKPFYMLPTSLPGSEPGQAETVACFDLLLPEVCEVVGGSLREHRLDELTSSMKAQGMIKSGTAEAHALQWYLDLRKFGSVPHGGFGLGFDRLICYLSGVGSIRDAVTFPRWHKRCDC